MKFEKYQANGNDFIVLDENYTHKSLLAKKLCSRKESVGADGLIFFNKYQNRIFFFNQDGSEANLCVNGLRCLGLYLYRHNILKKRRKINFGNTFYYLEVYQDNPFLIKVIFNKKDYSFQTKIFKQKKVYLIDIGNKHLICDKTLESKVSALVENYPEYNINFVDIISKNKIKIKTYEKGVGFTLNCGSGSFASCFVYHKLNIINEKVNVDDKLEIDLSTCTLLGKANFVFQGEI